MTTPVVEVGDSQIWPAERDEGAERKPPSSSSFFPEQASSTICHCHIFILRRRRSPPPPRTTEGGGGRALASTWLLVVEGSAKGESPMEVEEGSSLLFPLALFFGQHPIFAACYTYDHISRRRRRRRRQRPTVPPSDRGRSIILNQSG